MEKCTKALVEYFENELPKLKESYQWKIPNIEGFHLCGKKDYTSNIELKKFFNKQWQSSSFEDRVKISKTVVADWGGVRTNRLETLEFYAHKLESKNPSTPLKGVASYSKIYSIYDINKYAIYDARVAACLNAIQWNYDVKNGVAFHYVNGRNNITGNMTKKIGFTCQENFKIRNLVSNGWKEIKKDDTYQIYLDLLQTCLKFLPKYNLHDLEMVLFANAEIECAKAMDKNISLEKV